MARPPGLRLLDQAESLGITQAGVAEVFQAQVAVGQFTLYRLAVPLQKNLPGLGIPQGDAGFEALQPDIQFQFHQRFLPVGSGFAVVDENCSHL